MKQARPFTDWDTVPIVMDLPLASRVVGMSAEHLKKLAQKGIFPAFKTGNLWRVTKTALRKYCGEVE